MPRFKSRTRDELSVFAPPGDHDAFLVDADNPEVAVPGDVSAETEDAYIVGEGDEARAWPKATWELVVPPKEKK